MHPSSEQAGTSELAAGVGTSRGEEIGAAGRLGGSTRGDQVHSEPAAATCGSCRAGPALAALGASVAEGARHGGSVVVD